MRFIITTKIEEFDNVIEENEFYSNLMKGDLSKVACPITITDTLTERNYDAWDLSEQQIFDIISESVKNYAKGISTSLTFKALKCWKLKHSKVSSNFVEMCNSLRDSYSGYQRELVRDMTIPLI